MRQRPQRIGAGAAVALLLAACAGASAKVPDTAVAGVQLTREAVEPAAVATAVAGPREPDAGAVAAATAMPRLRVPRAAAERVRAEVIGGVERHWTVVVPPNTNEDDKLPVLIVLHGVGGFGGAMRRLGFDKLAAANSALVVYPDANGGSWNDGRPGMEPLSGTPTDDVAFLRALIDRTVADFGGDPARVSIAGFSNGALMASRAACDMPDKLRSVVLVSGAGPRDMAQRCKPTRPLSVMVVFGTGDVTVPYNGGQVASFGGKARGQVASVRELIDVWRTANGCSSTEVQEVVNAKPVITALRATGCRADILHYCIIGGQHEWVMSPTFDTTVEAWRFLTAHWA